MSPFSREWRPQCGEWKASRRGDVLIRDEPIALQSVTEVDICSSQRIGWEV